MLGNQSISDHAISDVSFTQTVTAAGIASAEAFGLPSTKFIEYASGIQSAEAFGTPSRFIPQITVLGVTGGYVYPRPRPIKAPAATQRFTLIGIASEESFGLPDLRLSYNAATVGIQSEEAFGNASVTMILTARGIWSQEKAGRVAIEQDWTEQNNLLLLLAA